MIRTGARKAIYVISAVGVLSGLGSFLLLFECSRRAQCVLTPEARASTSARQIRTAVELWRAQTTEGTCPGIAALIAAKILDPGHSERDPWGTPFEIRCTKNEVNVRSAGADLKMGSSDDVTVPAAK